MASTIGEAAQRHIEVHRIGRIIHITGDVDAADLFMFLVEDDCHGIVGLEIATSERA